MDEYDLIRNRGLRLKGDTRIKKKKHKKHGSSGDKKSKTQNPLEDERIEDASEHGNWWKTTKCEQIRNLVAVEFIPGCYARSLSNGRIVLGDPHPSGEAPDEEEIFTAIPAGTNKIAFKSGYDRYLSIDSNKRLVGISEAVGEAETFLPVYEDGLTALCSAFNDSFLSIDQDSKVRQIVAKSMKAGSNEMVHIRINNDPLFGG